VDFAIGWYCGQASCTKLAKIAGMNQDRLENMGRGDSNSVQSNPSIYLSTTNPT